MYVRDVHHNGENNFYWIFRWVRWNRNFDFFLWKKFWKKWWRHHALHSTPSTKRPIMYVWSPLPSNRSIVIRSSLFHLHCGPLRSIAVHCGPLRYLVGPWLPYLSSFQNCLTCSSTLNDCHFLTENVRGGFVKLPKYIGIPIITKYPPKIPFLL